MASTQITAAAAMKSFRGASITVQTAKPVKVKGDDGVVREAYKTDNVPLAEAHILGAAQREDGTVVITTIDGQRYETRGGKAAE